MPLDFNPEKNIYFDKKKCGLVNWGIGELMSQTR